MPLVRAFGPDLRYIGSPRGARMYTFLSIIHVFVCAFLILVVLLQQGRGGGLGSAFGGASQQVFGGRGAGNFMTRVTWGCATLFILTSVSLAYLSSSGDRSLRARSGQQTTTTTETKK